MVTDEQVADALETALMMEDWGNMSDCPLCVLFPLDCPSCARRVGLWERSCALWVADPALEVSGAKSDCGFWTKPSMVQVQARHYWDCNPWSGSGARIEGELPLDMRRRFRRAANRLIRERIKELRNQKDQ